MKILLIGKNGQLGEALLRIANEQDLNIVAFGREELDISNHEAVSQMIANEKPTVVINSSAYHVVPDCEAYPEKAFAVNAIAVKNLAKLCHAEGIQFITYSTDYVFDGTKGSPYVEIDCPNPLQMYGISKYAGERAALNYHNNSLVIRADYIYGGLAGSRSKKGNFVLNILKQAQEKKDISVTTLTVNPTYADHLADASLKLIQNNPLHGIYHLPNEGTCTLAEFAQKIISYANLTTTITPIEQPVTIGELQRPMYSALSNTKAKALSVILPSWDEALREYIAYITHHEIQN